MSQQIYYSVESMFFRKNIDNKLDFLLNDGDLNDAIHHTFKDFRNELPIIARQNAFNHFQSIIEVLYDGLNRSYTTDKQARTDLQSYFCSGNNIELLGDTKKAFKVSDDIFNGIYLYLIIEDDLNPKPIKIQIHGIGYNESIENDETIIDSAKGLIYECNYYEQNTVVMQDLLEFVTIDGNVESILKSPIDFEL